MLFSHVRRYIVFEQKGLSLDFFPPAVKKPRGRCKNVGCEKIMSTLENFKSNLSIGRVGINEVRLDRTRIKYILQNRFFFGL